MGLRSGLKSRSPGFCLEIQGFRHWVFRVQDAAGGQKEDHRAWNRAGLVVIISKPGRRFQLVKLVEKPLVS